MLDFQDVECVAARMEYLSIHSASFSFDVIVSRAVGAVPYLLKLAKPFLAPGGHVLLQRGHNGKQELSNHTAFFQEIGFQIANIIEVNFSFFNYPRYLIMFRYIC